MSRWHTTDFDMLPERAFQPRFGGKFSTGMFSGGMTLEGGGKSSKRAETPDPQMGAAALQQIQLNRDIFADYQANERPWMQAITNEALDISRDNLGLSREQVQRANALSDYQLESMRFNDARYRNTAIPFEDQLLSDVRRFDSAEYKQGLVDRSIGDVQQSFDKAQDQNLRGLSRMGVNPNSGMAMAARSMGDFEKAKAMADAANKTRQAADQVGLSTKMQMYGGMKGLAGLGATNAGLATSAIGAGLSGIGVGQNAAGGMMSYGGAYLGANIAAQGAMNTGISSGISGYGNYITASQNATKINNDADPFASILGAGAQLGAAFI